MWRVVIDGHWILLGAHIDDFIIACANQPVLDAFRKRLLEAFEGTYEGPLEHYLRCEIARDTTTLSQKHYAEEILRSYRFWDMLPRNTPINLTLAFQKMTVTPTPNLTSTAAIVASSAAWVTSSP